MSDRVRIYNRSGRCIADPRVTAERTWTLNDEGEAEFTIATSDWNCREDFIRFGHWLLVENDKLAPWVGMIDTPREWKRRSVAVRAYSPEHLLSYRDVPKQLATSGKPGTIFKQILALMNRAEETIIEEGSIWTGGADLPAESLSGDSMLDYLRGVVEHSGGEYSFTPIASKNRLRIEANWTGRVGRDSSFPLEESYNLADEGNALREQGPFYNELWGYGNGGGQEDRPFASVLDRESISKYGLRQGTKSYSDYTTEGAVLAALKAEINKSRLPVNAFQVSATDNGETFNQLHLGDSYPLRLWSVGFGVYTRARLTSAHFDPSRGKVDMVLEEVLDDSQN